MISELACLLLLLLSFMKHHQHQHQYQQHGTMLPFLDLAPTTKNDNDNDVETSETIFNLSISLWLTKNSTNNDNSSNSNRSISSSSSIRESTNSYTRYNHNNNPTLKRKSSSFKADDMKTSTTTATTTYFVRAPSDLLQQTNQPIAFRTEWYNDFNVSLYQQCSTIAIASIPPPPPPPPPPKQLNVPNFVDIFVLQKNDTITAAAAAAATNNTNNTKNKNTQYYYSLQQVGMEARRLIDQNLYASNTTNNNNNNGNGAILFRGLHQLISTPTDFATFWSYVVGSSGDTDSRNNDKGTKGGWIPMTDHLSCYNRKRQRYSATTTTTTKALLDVDRVDVDVPSITIGPHNEHSCNPFPSSKIMFYAMDTAEHQPVGYRGETLLRKNEDIVVPPEAWKVLQKAGGIAFERSYPHESSSSSFSSSTEQTWQQRCGTHDETLARQYFANQHGITNITFDNNNDGTLIARNHLDGYIPKPAPPTTRANGSSNNEMLLWYNRLDYGFSDTLADGTVFPRKLQCYLKHSKWHETYQFMLQKGDWLVLDNRRIQHGRLPYRDSVVQNKDNDTTTDPATAPPRQLLVTYTT